MTWSELGRRWGLTWPLRVSQRAADVVVVGAAAGLEVLTLALAAPANWPWAVLVAVLQTAPVLWRRRWPLLVLAVLIAASASEDFIGVHFGGYLVAIPAAIYSVADRGGRARWLVLWAGVVWMIGAAGLGLVETRNVLGLIDGFPAVVTITAYLLGENARTRRAYLAELEARLARQEQDRQRARRAAVEEERARIARELHDVVTHHVSAIAVQAEMHRAVRPDAPAGPILASIAGTARKALDELAWLLGALREAPPDAAPREPEPGLASLEALAERAREAGLDVRLQVTGAGRPLPAALELSAYRIVQEATTNACKHAPGARVDVSVCHEPDGLRICVVDDGPSGSRAGAPGPGEGHGLIGMRERVALFGGTLEAGPVAGGGFRVAATLPAGD